MKTVVEYIGVIGVIIYIFILSAGAIWINLFEREKEQEDE